MFKMFILFRFIRPKSLVKLPCNPKARQGTFLQPGFEPMTIVVRIHYPDAFVWLNITNYSLVSTTKRLLLQSIPIPTAIWWTCQTSNIPNAPVHRVDSNVVRVGLAIFWVIFSVFKTSIAPTVTAAQTDIQGALIIILLGTVTVHQLARSSLTFIAFPRNSAHF